jgi:hypothetical protein
MKSHNVWRPRLDRDPLFNPFVPATEHHLPSDRIEFPEIEESGDDEVPAEVPVPSDRQEER